MSKSNWGITSGFTGKLGNVVGFNWKGQNIQRALVQIADPRSEAQILQRARFRMISQMGSVLYDAIYEGFRQEASTTIYLGTAGSGASSDGNTGGSGTVNG